jgi:peptidyl-prolyl cis-trans isomerase SurA
VIGPALILGLSLVAASDADEAKEADEAALKAQEQAEIEEEKNALVIERIVAIVGSDIVLLSEVERVVDQMMQVQPIPAGVDRSAAIASRRREILDTLVAEKLLEQQIRALRIDVTEAEVERVVQETMTSNRLTEHQLEQALLREGLTLDEYRDGLQKQLMKAKIIQLKVKSRVQVSDQEVKNHLASERTKASKRYRVKARHIIFLVKTPDDEASARKKATDALERLDKGANFADLAREVSEGPSASSGGLLGTFGRGDMVPEFEKAAFGATPGVAVGPVRSPFGWHLILVEERVTEASEPGTYEAELEERVRGQLYEKAVEREFSRYVDELKAKTYIELRERAFER